MKTTTRLVRERKTKNFHFQGIALEAKIGNERAQKIKSRLLARSLDPAYAKSNTIFAEMDRLILEETKAYR